MDKQQIEAIRARDAACAVPKAPIEAVQWGQSNADRRALLAAYDALANSLHALSEAARKVTCRCWNNPEYGPEHPCPDCADLRKLLEGER